MYIFVAWYLVKQRDNFTFTSLRGLVESLWVNVVAQWILKLTN